MCGPDPGKSYPRPVLNSGHFGNDFILCTLRLPCNHHSLVLCCFEMELEKHRWWWGTNTSDLRENKEAGVPLASYWALPPIAGQIFAVSADRDPCVCRPSKVGWLTRAAAALLPQVLEPSLAACRRPGCKVKGGCGSPNMCLHPEPTRKPDFWPPFRVLVASERDGPKNVL